MYVVGSSPYPFYTTVNPLMWLVQEPSQEAYSRQEKYADQPLQIIEGGKSEVSPLRLFQQDPNARLENKDLKDIVPNDGIIINRTKDQISPFVPIQKRLLTSRSGTIANLYGVEIEDLSTQTGWKNVGNVSGKYLLIPNQSFYELMLSIAEQSGVNHEVSRIYWDGKRFAVVIDLLEYKESIGSNDEVGLSLFARQSYDRSWSISASLMGKRYACDNGYLSGEFFAHVNFKHLEGESHWSDVIQEGLRLLDFHGDNLSKFASSLRLLKQYAMKEETLRKVRNKLLTRKMLGASLWGKILDRYLLREEASLYGLLNASTHVFWHNDKQMTAQDYKNNELVVSKLLGVTKVN